MTPELMHDAMEGYSKSEVCRAMHMSRSGMHARKRRAPSKHAQKDLQVRKHIKREHIASRGTYGSPRIHARLQQIGHTVGRVRVRRLMRDEALSGRVSRRFVRTTDSNHTNAITTNALNRDFKVGAVNERWAGDITYIPTYEGWLYLAVLIDVGSRRVVGYASGESMPTELCETALHRALAFRNPPAGLVHHSDRGCLGEFNRWSQHLNNEELRWEQENRADDWNGPHAVHCVRQGVRRQADANTGERFGKPLRMG